VIIHSRKAEREVLEILEKFKSIKVILHCFSGSFNLVKKGIGLGCYFSIPANIVRSEHFQKMAQVIPREKILTETDSPYLSPFKEKENEPAFITESMKKISKIWKIPETEVEKKIEDNFRKVFGF
jgi:TatD DNase family protein